jgi:glycosyltransferase involved in cell wall biosynthesis
VSPLVVLVPARNEARQTGPCVASLISQIYPDFELLVLDDHSIDGTRAAASTAPRAGPGAPLLRTHTQRWAGPW